MEKATADFLKQNEELYIKRKEEIINAPDSLKVIGNTYYVSTAGNDSNNGKSPETSWKSLKKVSEANLNPGDAVLFYRGDLFRGTVKTKPGVSYGAYGTGDKPTFYGGEHDYASTDMWELIHPDKNIWKCKEKMLDAGTLVFNGGEAHSRKLIPSYIYGKFVCRDDPYRPFDVKAEMTKDLDIYWHFESSFATEPSKGEDFPVPEVSDAYGTLYLRCDKGNPGEVFDSIEAIARRFTFRVGENENVTIDNICMKYYCFGVVAGGYSKGLTVKNCEIGWIGGNIQHYLGTDPNYPQGGRGTVTRYGNGVEIYGGCDNYTVTDCYIYEVYDAAVTHQVTTNKNVTMTNIRYTNNLIERCVYGIEYFLDQIDGERESYMDNIEMSGNIIRLSGYGWGQQRHNQDTPAHIKGWSYTNTAENYSIFNNIFDRSAYRMLHLVALKGKYCPEMHDNTYIQHLGATLGQYGGNEIVEPEIHPFDEHTEDTLKNIFKEKNAKIYYIDNSESENG